MTRIVSGSARGRRLAVPDGDGTRPTADRAREALFSTLESLLGSLRERRFLDLYAGSGAVGLESLSRGAVHALMVESNPKAARVIGANVAALRLRGAQVQVARVEQVMRRRPDGPPYDVLFADPPYAVPDDELRGVLRAARASGWLAPDAVVAVERPSRG
ncbi:MAG: 16S rRNA (guanine(966)-N(2))-methyltransferase RsmD, partial [Chloroflexota bacterium]|nr:16S rRNA (guanine(966)-N(2))-methyltransferase RsmD [Chloroflexota bacterium]